MKKTLTLAALLAALILPTAAFSKAPPKTEKNDKGGKGDPAEKYDTNHNGKIDKGTEADALRKAFEGDKTGPLKKYDTNHNGNLEDSEINSIHVPIKKGKK